MTNMHKMGHQKRNLIDVPIWILSLILIFFASILYLFRIKISGHFYGDTDFFSFYESMRFYFSGQNLYSHVILEPLHGHIPITKSSDLNPPFLTLLFLPLYFFNYANAFLIWTIFSIMAMYTSIGLILKIYPEYQKYFGLILAGFGIYIWNSATISYGQVSHLLLLLLALSWICAREKKDVAAGLFMGLACAIKIFCGLFLIYFFCLKRYRLLLSTLITGTVLFGITLLLFGIKNYFGYCHTLTQVCWFAESWSVSFKSFFIRLFSATENNHVIFNSPFLSETLIALCTLILWCALIYTWHELQKKSIAIHDTSTQNFDRGFSLTIIAIFLLSPLGWSYYFNLLIIPYLILISHYKDDKIHLLCIGLLLLSSLPGELIRAYDIKNISQIIFNGGVGFYILITLLVLNFHLIYKKNNLADHSHSKHFVPPYLWLVIYMIALIPSIASQIKIIENLGQLAKSLA